MGAFLWTIAICAACNTAACIWLAFNGGLIKPESQLVRAIDSICTAAVGAWALWLIAKGAY